MKKLTYELLSETRFHIKQHAEKGGERKKERQGRWEAEEINELREDSESSGQTKKNTLEDPLE